MSFVVSLSLSLSTYIKVWIENIPRSLELPKYLQVKQVTQTLLEASGYPLKGRTIDETAGTPLGQQMENETMMHFENENMKTQNVEIENGIKKKNI
jgi:hypothetical protein